MKLVTVVGARPQFVKAAVVSQQLRQNANVQELLVHTGQHYDQKMSDVFFHELGIPAPDYHLGIGSAPQGAQTGRMLEAVENVLLKVMPDTVVVYGDTNSTLAGALAAAKLHIPVAHVEAGLRSYNRRMSEENNRVLTDHLSDMLFAPTEVAVENLKKEGINGHCTYLVGDVMYDAVLRFQEKAGAYVFLLKKLEVNPKQYILATIHRAENTDDLNKLSIILAGLGRISEELPVLLPLHPRTRDRLRKSGMEALAKGIRIMEPVGYLQMLMLEKNASLIVTDSGGVQKEAFFYRVPCVTVRTETEWTELVDLGCNHLAPPRDEKVIEAAFRKALKTKVQDADLYGNGHAAERICNVLLGRAEDKRKAC